MKKITDRASDIAVQQFGTWRVTDEQALATLGQALDEWQQSVEARLASVGLGFGLPIAPRVGAGFTVRSMCGDLCSPPVGSSLPEFICMLAPGHAGPHSDCQGENPMLWSRALDGGSDGCNFTRFDEEKPPAVRIHDPGPGRYDAEPEDVGE